MTRAIPLEYQEFVRNSIRDGTFRNENEVIGEALRLLKRREEIRTKVRLGLVEFDRGEGIDLDDDSLEGFFDDIKSRGRGRLEADHGARDLEASF